MRATSLGSRGSGGFSLIELLVVLAIIAILATLLLSGMSASKCKSIKATALTAIRTCESTIAGWTSGSVQNVLDCLKGAQDAIDEMAAQTDWWKNGESAVKAVVTQINKAIDEMVTRVDNETDKTKLTNAKLTTP